MIKLKLAPSLSFRNWLLPLILCCYLVNKAYSQTPQIGGQDSTQNPIITAVPFLTIAPDARSAGMGDVGVATAPDANATYWNKAKIPFLEQAYGVSLSYTPWLQKIVGDVNLAYLSGFKKLSKRQVIFASLRYFDLGSIEFTNSIGMQTQIFDPREYAISAGYAMKLSEKLGLGFSGRFIYSNLSGSINIGALNTRPGTTFGIDISTYYTNDDIVIAGYDARFSLGADISNIGFKITYASQQQQDFIPTNLRLGTALAAELDPFNSLTLALDFNKLLVPTPKFDGQGMREDPSLLSGILGSFFDAPGGLSEELKEITLGLGIEYWYNDLFSARGGYFHESLSKGARQYYTLGLGLKYQFFGLDFAYLIARGRNHPLENTIRFTLHINFEKESEQQPTEILEGL